MTQDALAQRGTGVFHLVGHDWGAAIAWVLGGLAPQRVLTLNPISVPHPDGFLRVRSDPDSCQHEASGYIDFFLMPDSEDVFLANGAAGLRSFYEGISEEDVDVYVDALGTKEAPSAGLNWYRANNPGAGTPSLGSVSIPTMFIWSDEDPALCRDGAELTAEFVDAPYRFEVIEGVNHWISEIAPDDVSALLLDHFEG